MFPLLLKIKNEINSPYSHPIRINGLRLMLPPEWPSVTLQLISKAPSFKSLSHPGFLIHSSKLPLNWCWVFSSGWPILLLSRKKKKQQLNHQQQIHHLLLLDHGLGCFIAGQKYWGLRVGIWSSAHEFSETQSLCFSFPSYKLRRILLCSSAKHRDFQIRSNTIKCPILLFSYHPENVTQMSLFNIIVTFIGGSDHLCSSRWA